MCCVWLGTGVSFEKKGGKVGSWLKVKRESESVVGCSAVVKVRLPWKWAQSEG
jgi:hypothetical protein